MKSISCSGEIHCLYMEALLKVLCQPDFTIDSVVGTRCKKIFGGKCCWTAYYRMSHGVINSKLTFKTAVNRIAEDKPYRSRVVACGRYGSNALGLFITYANIQCLCPMDFEYVPTPFRILEQSKTSSTSVMIEIMSINRTETSDILDIFKECKDDIVDDSYGDEEFIFLDLLVSSLQPESNVMGAAAVSIDKSISGLINSKLSTESQWLVYRKKLLGDKFNNFKAAETIAKFDLLMSTEAGESKIWRKDPSGVFEISMSDCMKIEATLILNNFVDSLK